MNMIKGVLTQLQKDNEERSWKKDERVSFRINTIVNGYGLQRELTAVHGETRGQITENEARQLVASLKKKGFETSLYRSVTVTERLV